MSEVNRKISYITDYLSAYEAKIRLANRAGLFDEAKMFELFAVKLCELWFHQQFHNLNQDTANYPNVDLVSEDGKQFVQVSTIQDIPSKIKRTLEHIRDSKSPSVQSITNVVFFMLHNDSVEKVKDLCDDQCIGKIPFYKDKALITTHQIINKAMEDVAFLNKLHDFLWETDQTIRICSNTLQERIEESMRVGIEQIDCLINDEYRIDRSNLREKYVVTILNSFQFKAPLVRVSPPYAECFWMVKNLYCTAGLSIF